MAALSHTSDKLFRTGESLGSCLRVLLLAKTEQLVMDAKLFGMHSLPAGGATANSGVPDRLIKHHGCWRSETAKDGYLKDSVQRRLSKRLGV